MSRPPGRCHDVAYLGLSFHPGAFLLAAFLYYAGGWAAVTAAFSAALAHELGHLTTAAIAGAEVRRIDFGAVGPVIELSGEVTHREEMGIAAAGPLAGMLFAALCLWLDTPYFRFAGLISILTTAFNLLPVYPMDGGRLAYLLLQGTLSEKSTKRVLRVVGTLCGIGVMLTGWRIRSVAAAAAGIWMTVLANAPGLR